MNIETFKSLSLAEIIEIVKQPLYMVYKITQTTSKEKVILSESEIRREYVMLNRIQTNVLKYRQCRLEDINFAENELGFYETDDLDACTECISFNNILYLVPNENEAKNFIESYNNINPPITVKSKYGSYYLEVKYASGCKTCGTLKYGDWELVESQSGFRID